MAKLLSDIISTTIDENFPIAGQDNDSQGFRDNFSILKNNFASAKAELDEILTNAARKDTNNNFTGKNITDANLDQVSWRQFSKGSISAAADIEYVNGHYQTMRIISDPAVVVTRTLTFRDWPDSGRYGKLTLAITGDEGPQVANVEFNTIGTGKIFYDADFPATLSVTSSSNPKIVEFWTVDGGLTVFARYIGSYAERP